VLAGCGRCVRRVSESTSAGADRRKRAPDAGSRVVDTGRMLTWHERRPLEHEWQRVPDVSDGADLTRPAHVICATRGVMPSFEVELINRDGG
jgi:hypothetical protein